MNKPISFYDPYGNTRLSGRKTFLFCAYHGFIIPHDIAAAILYAEVYKGALNIDFGRVLGVITPSLNSFLADADWYLAALKDMGYQDLVDEFNRLNKRMRCFMKKWLTKNPYSISAVLRKLDEILPKYSVPEYIMGR